MDSDDEPEAIARALEEERAAREAAERQLLALKAEKRLLEHRVINARRTLAYGLGRALIEARSVKGLLALPGRIRQLRVKQKAKRRERVPNSFAEDPAALLALVDPALERARDEGVQAAAEWVSTQDAAPESKARALAELAHRVLEDDPMLAARTAEDAVALFAGDHRLFSVAVRLYEAGLVAEPAGLIAQFRDALTLSGAQRRMCAFIEEDAALLERGSWTLPAPPVNQHTDRRSGLAILCSPRGKALPEVAQARAAIAPIDLADSVIELSSDPNLSDFALVHIFADSLEMACTAAADARAAGCRIILDLALPPCALIVLPGSARARAAAIRLKGLAEGCDAMVTRSRAMADALDELGIAHRIVTDVEDVTRESIDEDAVTAAIVEYGARPGVKTIAFVAALDDDPGLLRGLKAFAAAAVDDEAAQLIVVGSGTGAERFAREARRLSIGDRVHFAGNPPPQRWTALLAGFDLAIFPGLQGEALGSDVPALLRTTVALGCSVLATDSAWASQLYWNADAQSILPGNGDWNAAVRERLKEPGGSVALRARDGVSIEKVYRLLLKQL